jgi:imidazolonepropionase-like amidohydrolase
VVPFDAPYAGIVAFAPDADAATVRRAVDLAIDERGADAIKLYDQREQLLTFRPTATVMAAAQLDAAVDQCRKRGVPSTMHLLTVESFRRALAAGVTSIAHLPSDAPLEPRDVEAAARAAVVVEPTVSLLHSLSWLAKSGTPLEPERLQMLRDLRLRTSRELARDHWHPMLAPWFLDGLARSAAGRTALLGGLYDGQRIFEYYGGIVGHGIDNLGRLLAAGVPLACGTDAGAVPCTPAMVGLELWLWRQLFGDAVVPPALTLQAATWNAARALGVEAVGGRLVPGAPADLVAYDRSPLAEPSVLGERAYAVWREGQLAAGPLLAGEEGSADLAS